MKALQFRMSVPRIVLTRTLGSFSKRAFTSSFAPVQLEEIDDAVVRGDHWIVVRPALTGICGSDQKQVLLKGHFDNPLSGMLSFPHVLGHESAGVVAEIGRGVTRVRPGDRVVINPWLSCEPRGITPVCPACAEGNLSLCGNFDRGDLTLGLHLGNCLSAPGAYAPRVALHESQVFPLPTNVGYEQAVLADPFCVSFHAVLKDPPDGDEPTVLVYGAGTIGLAAVAAVKVVKPKARILVIARYPQQVAAAKRLGVETFRGVRKHAMEHYVDLCASCEVDLGFLVTHRYPLDEWKAAFSTAIAKTTGCVKVAFAF